MSQGPFGSDAGSFLAGATTCPHCNGVAEVSAHPRLNQVCNLCGAPRIDVGEETKLSGKEIAPLKAARTAERKRLQWKVGGVFGGATSGFIFLLWTMWALLFSAGSVWAFTGFAFAAPFIALAIGGFIKSKGQAVELDKSLGEAWKNVARDVLVAHPEGMTAKELSEVLPLSEKQAEDIAVDLSVDNAVMSRVTNDGRLLLQARAGQGMRIDAGAPIDPQQAIEDPLEQRFAELEQAQQESQAVQQPQHMKK